MHKDASDAPSQSLPIGRFSILLPPLPLRKPTSIPSFFLSLACCLLPPSSALRAQLLYSLIILLSIESLACLSIVGCSAISISPLFLSISNPVFCFSCQSPFHFAYVQYLIRHVGAVYSGEVQSDIPTNAAVDLTKGNVVKASGDSKLPPWVEAILFIRIEDEKGSADLSQAKIRCCNPERHLPKGMIEDIFQSALIPVSRNTRTNMDEKFMFRVRDKTLPGSMFRDESRHEDIGTAVSVASVFYNCYCHFQYLDNISVLNDQLSSSGMRKSSITLQPLIYQQAMIVVSRWPFPQMAFRLLDQLEEALLWQTQEMRHSSDAGSDASGDWKEFEEEGSRHTISPTSSRSEGTKLSMVGRASDLSSRDVVPRRAGSVASVLQGQSVGSIGVDMDEDIVTNVLIVAWSQIGLWPAPMPGVLVYLHSFGGMLNHVIETDVLSTFGANLSFGPVLQTINWVSLFGPLGLLQHIWTLWEILVTGQDIVVVAPTAAQATELVLGLASLLHPVASVGDFRPYINPSDSDMLVLAATAQLKHGDVEGAGLDENVSRILSRTRSMIVGVTDPSALQKLEDFAAALFVYPQEDDGYLTDSDAAYKGLRTRNTAEFFCVESNVPLAAKKSLLMSYNSSKKAGPDSFSHMFQSWLEKGTRKTALVCRKDPSTVTLNRLLMRIKKLHPDDRCVLGDQLLRDHFKSLTLAYFSPAATPTTSVGSKVDLARERKEYELEKARLSVLKSADEKGMLFLGLEELRMWLGRVPQAFAHNVPVIIMWTLALTGYWILFLLGVPVLFIMVAAFMFKIPEQVPPRLEMILQMVFPDSILYPTGKDDAASSADMASASASADHGEDAELGTKANFSGVWKRVKLDNYENLLAAQGASYVQRKLAGSITMIHTITMDDALTVFRLQEKGGPIDNDNTYQLDGTALETVTSKVPFRDTVVWKGGRLVMTKVKLPEQNYQLEVSRWLEAGGKVMRMEAKYRELKPGGKVVVSKIQYDLMGPSPNPPLASPSSGPGSKQTENGAASSSSGAAGSAAATVTRPDFSGVWQRTKTHNFEAFIGAAGAGYMQRKLAAQMAMTHTITMNPPELTAVRLQEKGGPINMDNTLTLGAEFQAVEMTGKNMKHRIYWVDNMLVTQRRAANDSFEMILTRTLDTETNVDAPQIILKSVHRDLASGTEVEATSWFTKVGPSPNSPPSPNISLLPKNSSAATGGVAAANASGASAGNGSASALASQGVEDNDNDDNDDDDDEVSLAKMRTVSVAAKSRLNRALTNTGGGSSSSSAAAPSSFASKRDGAGGFVDFSGEWSQNGSSSSSMMNWMHHAARKRFTIRMTRESLNLVEIDHKTLVEDTQFVIGSPDFITIVNKRKKAIKARCYWEGGVLVVHKVIANAKYELFVRRELEEGGQQMRQVTIRKDKTTGTQSEQVAVFKRIK